MSKADEAADLLAELMHGRDRRELAGQMETANGLEGPSYTYADSVGGIVTYWPDRDPFRRYLPGGGAERFARRLEHDNGPGILGGVEILRVPRGTTV